MYSKVSNASPESHKPSPVQGGQGPEVVEWMPEIDIQKIVVPTVIVEVLVPLTVSMNWVPGSEDAATT